MTEKMIEHLKCLYLGTSFRKLMAYSDTYGSIEELYGNDTNFWFRVEKNKFAKHIFATFIANPENFNMLLTDYAQLKLNVVTVNVNFVPHYLEKNAAIDFLINFKRNEKIPTFLLKKKQLTHLLDSICLGSPEQNRLIMRNYLEQTKESFKSQKAKMTLRMYLLEKFSGDIDDFAPYFTIKTQGIELVIKKEYVGTLFLDKKIMQNDYPLPGDASKEYDKMVNIVTKIIGDHFKFKIKASPFDTGTYSVTWVGKDNRDYGLESLWDILFRQYCEGNTSPAYLLNYLDRYLLNDKLMQAVEPKKTKGKLSKI